MFTIFFGIDTARNFEEAQNSDRRTFSRYFHHMLTEGVYGPPSAFEAAFLSNAHSGRELKKTLEALRRF